MKLIPYLTELRVDASKNNIHTCAVPGCSWQALFSGGMAMWIDGVNWSDVVDWVKLDVVVLRSEKLPESKLVEVTLQC